MRSYTAATAGSRYGEASIVSARMYRIFGYGGSKLKNRRSEAEGEQEIDACALDAAERRSRQERSRVRERGPDAQNAREDIRGLERGIAAQMQFRRAQRPTERHARIDPGNEPRDGDVDLRVQIAVKRDVAGGIDVEAAALEPVRAADRVERSRHRDRLARFLVQIEIAADAQVDVPEADRRARTHLQVLAGQPQVFGDVQRDVEAEAIPGVEG